MCGLRDNFMPAIAQRGENRSVVGGFLSVVGGFLSVVGGFLSVVGGFLSVVLFVH